MPYDFYSVTLPFIVGFNVLLGAMWLINATLRWGGSGAWGTAFTRRIKAWVYLALVILGAVMRGGMQFSEPVDTFFALVSTGFLFCFMVFLIASFRSERPARTRRTEDGREIPTRDVTIIAYCALAGAPFALGLLFGPFIRAYSEVDSIPTSLRIISCVALPTYIISVFVGLLKFKNWARIMAIVAAIITLPVSWYALWVLLASDARHLFVRNAPAKASL